MATATEELASLKIRASKREGEKTITIIDHAAGDNRTCTILEGVKILATWVNAGNGARVVHIVDHEKERERKLTNPKGSTIVRLNCRTPEQYSQFQAAKEVYFEEAKDPQIAIDLIIKALTAFSRGTIREWIRQGHDEAPGPPKAKLPPDLPAWLKD